MYGCLKNFMLSNNNILIFINLFITWNLTSSQWLSISSFKSRFSPPCVNNTFHCGDGNCITIDKLHDSTNDCYDGSDEFCFPGYVKCGEICVEAKNADNCLGFKNCFKSKIFPKFCPYLKQRLCNANGTFQCKGYGECIFAEWMFDKKQDCYDGSDLDVEYVSIFKKILNNQYPEELIYHLSNKEITNKPSNIPLLPTLWPTIPIFNPNLVPIITPELKISNSNRKPIKPLEGLELMNVKTTQKAPLLFPTLIPYQITKSQNDNTEQSLSTTLNIESTTINGDTFPIIFSSTPFNKQIAGHLPTTQSVNFLNTPKSTINKLDNGKIKENVYFPGIIEKNKSLDVWLETLKENTQIPSKAFVEKATKQINESHNYPKTIQPIDKSTKENIKNDSNLNYTYLDNIFGDEELITSGDNNNQPTGIFQQSVSGKKTSTPSNTISSLKNNNIIIQTTTQNSLKLNEISNKEGSLKFLTSTTQSQDDYLSGIFNEKNNFYTTTTIKPDNVPENYGILLSSKETIKTTQNTYKKENIFTTSKITTLQNNNFFPSTSQNNNQYHLTTTNQQDIQKFLTTPKSIVEITTKSIKNKDDDSIKDIINHKNKIMTGNEEHFIPLTSGLFTKSNVLEDKYNSQNVMGKQFNIPQNWNFFGVKPNELAKSIYSIGDLSTTTSRSIFLGKIFPQSKESKIDFTTTTKKSIENLSTTVTSIFGLTGNVVNNIKENDQNLKEEKKVKENANENISGKKDTDISKTTHSLEGSQKNVFIGGDTTTTTVQPIKTSVNNQKMSPEDYNICIKKFMNENFHHLNTYGESMCKCSPGDTVGFLGLCQHKYNPIIIKLHVEKICGMVPSKEIENRVTSGITSLLTDDDDVDDVCFRTTKKNELIAEVFCKNCSFSTVENHFKDTNEMEKKYKSKFFFTPGGNDVCNDSELNYCDKNATCVPLNEKYKCICSGDRKNVSYLEIIDTDYGRYCHNNEECDKLFGICIMYWLLLIPLLIFIIPCFCCLLYRICVTYNICGCGKKRYTNVFSSYFKDKFRRRSKNLIIEDIKEAQKWHPEATRPSSVHSTENFEANLRRKSAIILIDDEYTTRRSMRSRTSSIHSVEDYMIVEDETNHQENEIPNMVKTKAEIHDEPVVEDVEKNENGSSRSMAPLERHQSQPVINGTNSKTRFHSLTDINNIDDTKKIESKNNLPFVPKILTKTIILNDNDDIRRETCSSEVKTPHNSIENIPSSSNVEEDKLKNEVKNEEVLEEVVNVGDGNINENIINDVETKSIKSGKIFYSKNSSSSLLSNQPIIEEEENEGHGNKTFMEKLGGIYQPADDILLSGIGNSSVKSFPYIKLNRPGTSVNEYCSKTISTNNVKKKFFLNKKNVSSASLIQHVENNSKNDLVLPLSLKGSSSSITPSNKDSEKTDNQNIHLINDSHKDCETMWEHYQHDKQLPELSQTDSMDELERLFIERLKNSDEHKDNDDESKVNIEIKKDDKSEKSEETKNEYLIDSLKVPRFEISRKPPKLEKEIPMHLDVNKNVTDNSQNFNVNLEESSINTPKENNKELTVSEKVENTLEEITKASDYNFQKDNTFMNVAIDPITTKINSNEEKFNKDSHPSENSPKIKIKDRKIETVQKIKEQKIKYNTPEGNVNDKHIETFEKNKEEIVGNVGRDIKKMIERSISFKSEKKVSNPSIALITISKPSKTDKKRVVSHYVPKDDKSIRIVDIKITKDNKESDVVKSKRISLKPPIPKFTNLKVLPTKNSEPQSSRSVQERERTTTSSPIVRSLSFNLNKSPTRRTGLSKIETEIKGEKQLSSQGKMKLPKIDEKQLNKVDERKLNKHEKNLKLPSLNKDTPSPKIKDHKSDTILPKVNPTTSNVVKERVKQVKNDIVDKQKEIVQTKGTTHVPDKRFDELKSLKNIIPERKKTFKDREKEDIRNVKKSVKKEEKHVSDDKDNELCNICKHDDIQIHSPKKDKEQYKKKKIKKFINQQERAGKLTRNPNTRQLSAIIEKSEEHKNDKFIKKSNYKMYKYDDGDDVHGEGSLPSHRTVNFDISRENSLIPVHFDGRYVGPPSARESERILENEGDYYAGDVDLDLPSPYILPVSKDDMKNCIFNNNDLRKLKTNIPFYDWDRHSEILRSEKTNKRNIAHSMSEYNSEDTFLRGKGKNSHFSSSLNKQPKNESTLSITKKSNVKIQNNDLIRREKSNLSITSNEDGRWNLAVLHEGDFERIPLPPLSYSHKSSNKNKYV